MRAWPPNIRSLKSALPTVAAAPQQSVAVAIKKYPRQGCDWIARGLVCSSVALVGKQLVQAVRIKADHDLVSYNNGRGGAALIGADKLKNSLLVHADVFDLKWDPFLRKVGLGPGTWRSTRRTINYNFLF
jgi:hypothetical protein